MSLFGKLFRSVVASAAVGLGTGAATAQQPVGLPPAVLGVSPLGSDELAPASFGGGTFRSHGAPNCQPCPTIPHYPCPTNPTQPIDPMTGNPMPQPQQPARALDVGDVGGSADVGPTVGLDGAYIEGAAPRNMLRLRFDSMYNNNRPDRGDFFYGKSGIYRAQGQRVVGPGLNEQNIDAQELITTAEWAFTKRMSAFFDVPFRFINPGANTNNAGLSDIGFGFKYAFVYTQNSIVTAFLRFQAPTGDISTGLGNGNWWIEPGVLFQQQMSEKWQAFGEFRFLTPLGLRSDFTGNLLRYGLGTSYLAARGCSWYVAPTAEVVGWSVLSGKETDPDIQQAVNASGDTIVNAKIGVRFGFGQAAAGSPTLTRNDLYIGYARALTGEVWYKDLIRFEVRRFY